jgi:hypothetical protein
MGTEPQKLATNNTRLLIQGNCLPYRVAKHTTTLQRHILSSSPTFQRFLHAKSRGSLMLSDVTVVLRRVATMTPRHTGCPPPPIQKLTDRHGRDLKVAFAHAREWRTPKNECGPYATEQRAARWELLILGDGKWATSRRRWAQSHPNNLPQQWGATLYGQNPHFYGKEIFMVLIFHLHVLQHLTKFIVKDDEFILRYLPQQVCRLS